MNPVIINSEGGNVTYIARYNAMPKEAKEIIKESFDREKVEPGNKEIKFIESEFSNRINKFNVPIKGRKIYGDLYPYMELKFRNIIEIARRIKYCYDHDQKEAIRLKRDLGRQYGKDGNKLCNLYTHGYIDDFLNYTVVRHDDQVEVIAKKINEELKRFVEGAEYIFFIHDQSAVPLITLRIRQAISRNKKYIACHSAGNHVHKAKKIFEAVKDEAHEAGYQISEEHLKNKRGVPIYNFYLYYYDPRV